MNRTIQRRDNIAQLLAQFACAMHWFNPLVWFAAWRLHVERERACDDLVLANGVRASAYAEHLLNVTTRLSSSPWTQACGLAMARNSSLESRLRAVLREKQDRRSVTSTFAAIVLLLAVSIVIPVAMLRAADEKPAGKAKTGKVVTGKTSGAAATDNPMPKDKSAQALFRNWQANARINGKIPGGALRSLAKAASNFVEYNPKDERAPKLAELLKRMDISRDWTQAEAVNLLDDVTAVYDKLPSWAEDLPRFSIANVIRTGQPLPAELKNAPWGEAQPNGLRAAWLLDPQAGQHRLNTPLKSRILYHNAGKDSVVFRVLTWNQPSGHKARDATGAGINIRSTQWTTIGQIVACRLGPGEYTEVVGAGIGVGADRDQEDWRGTRVGSWIHANDGDEVTFTPAAVSAAGDDGRLKEIDDSIWWLSFITNRLDRDAPLPDDAAERRRILDRAVRDLFGTPPTQEETATFVADKARDAMTSLAKRLAKRAGTTSFTGKLQSGETKFRVLPVDPEAAKKPRVATGPGRYQLGDQVRLVIVRKGNGVNEANLVFYASDPKTDPPATPFEIKLPDGYNTWAIAWKRDTTILWVAEKGVMRSVDFTNPADVKETRLDPDDIVKVPERFRDALRPTFEK